MHHNHTASFLIQQQASKYTSHLRQWQGQVLGARRTLDAYRIAANPPTRGGLLASLGSVVASEKTRATSAVERNLAERLEALSDEEFVGAEPALRRLCAGHWPSLYHRIEQRRRVTGA